MTSAETQTASTRAQDEEAIRALYRQIMDGWNQGSGEKFAAPFATDGEQMSFEGSRFRGRQEIAGFHQMLFDRFLRGSRLIGRVTDIRFLTPEIALAHAIGGTIMPDETNLAPDRNSVQSMVAVRRDGAWRLARLHNSRAEFVGRPEAAANMTEELRRLL